MSENTFAQDQIKGALSGSRHGDGCEDVYPRGYASLMDLYENNFIRFRRLVDDLGSIDSIGVSQVPGCQTVYLKVIERSKYTTTIRLTYIFNENGRLLPEPDLQLRIYHDAGLVEVIAGHLRHGRQRLDHVPSMALKAKWRLNRLLFKWLGYCLHQGHRIHPAEAIF